MKKLILALMLTLAGSTALAQTKGGKGAGGHGGDAVQTPDGLRFLDVVRTTRRILDLESDGSLDELSAVLKSHPGFSAATYYGGNRTVPAINKVMSSVDSLTFYTVQGPLPQLNDRGFVLLNWTVNGEIVRLALQNPATNEVYVDRDFYPQLPRRDQLAFLMHEGLIRAYLDDIYNRPLTSTERIADVVNATFNTRSMSARSVARYLCEADIMVDKNSNFGLSTLAGQTGGIAFPTQVVAFSKTDRGCNAITLTTLEPREGVHTPSSGLINGLINMYTWSFKYQDENNISQSAFFTITEGRGRDSHNDYSFQASGYGVAGTYMQLQRSHFKFLSAP